MDSVNKADTEFLIDCAAFTTPSVGHLNLYLTPIANAPPFTMPLIVVPDVGRPQSNQAYPLSQVFELGQTVPLFPGACEFNAPDGTFWTVNQLPVSFLWPATGPATLKLTAVTTSITYSVGPAFTQGTWIIRI
jgi:hypothetical protein